MAKLKLTPGLGALLGAASAVAVVFIVALLASLFGGSL